MLLFVILLSNKLLVLALWETCGQYLVLPLAARLYFLFWPCKLALFKFAFFFLCFLLLQTLCIWCWKRQTFPSIFSIHKCDIIDMSVDINKWVVERLKRWKLKPLSNEPSWNNGSDQHFSKMQGANLIGVAKVLAHSTTFSIFLTSLIYLFLFRQ